MITKKKKQKTDTRVHALPYSLEHLNEDYKAIKYGHTLYLEGPGLTTKIINEIREKINNNESVVICITGPPGTGKTYFGMRFAEKLDPNFHIIDTPPPDPYKDTSQVTFSREQIAYLTGENTPLVRGQPILTDESHWGIGARSWQNRDQQEVVNYLAAIRSKGFVLIIVVLHTRMIDALLRDFVLNYEFQVKERGIAVCYRRFFPPFGTEPYKTRLGKMKLRLPDYYLCNYLDCLRGPRGCRHLHGSKDKRCETIRAIYERRKEWFLNEKGRQQEMEEKVTEEDLIKTFYEHRDELTYTTHGNIEPACLKVIAKQVHGMKLGKHRTRDLAKELQILYPELQPEQE